MNGKDVVKTREIAEAAVFYLNGLLLQSYEEKYWFFKNDGRAETMRLDLINKRIKVEPLEFMDAVRRVKSFSNEGMRN